MKIEYEATFFNIDKNKIREKLKNIAAKLVKKRIYSNKKNFFITRGDDKGFIRFRK